MKNEVNVVVIKAMFQEVEKAYSLLAIQQHLYKTVQALVKFNMFPHVPAERIVESAADCGYFFELIYDGEFDEADQYLSVLSDNCQHATWKYFNELYDSVTVSQDDELKKHADLFKSLLY
ncbi:hypothetical protein C2I27_03345 [Priestia megaterium]|uniref:hypothetical protein n=1 Tax=Priestia megaterium TaxID=1404 RepID=UPI000D518C4F|nr:hypothetical protein [Priestia megaterium]PVC74933.1 hypothetical protein C2I27_03345 [Priestia megaterium]